MSKLIKFLIYIITYLSFLGKPIFAYLSEIKSFLLDSEDVIKTSFTYSIEPFGNDRFIFNSVYKNVRLKVLNRSFGEFEIIDQNKNFMGTDRIYNLSLEIGYKNIIIGSFHYYLSIGSEYEYYYLFSDITLGGSVGISFENNSIYSLILIEGYKELLFKSATTYAFPNNSVLLGVGGSFCYSYQDFFLFVSSKIFDYSGIELKILSGAYYGTSKGVIPFFETSVGYKVFSVEYGISFQEGMELFQSWCLDVKM